VMIIGLGTNVRFVFLMARHEALIQDRCVPLDRLELLRVSFERKGLSGHVVQNSQRPCSMEGTWRKEVEGLRRFRRMVLRIQVRMGACSLPRLTNGYDDDRPQTQIPLSKANTTC
jgi:hypothetical protein